MNPLLLTCLILGVLCLWSLSAGAAEGDDGALWVHPKCEALPTGLLGPFVRMPDKTILAVDGTGLDEAKVMVSADEGVTWDGRPMFAAGAGVQVSNERAVMCTRDGVLIVAYMNLHEKDWRWNSKTHDADPGTQLPTYAVRSLDGGVTWEAPRKMHDEWSGCVRNMIQTRSGAVVFTAMKLLTNPGRHTVLTYVSTDDGASWTGSHVIDLGGNGHHGGITEATVIELEDGRLWKLIRTNWGKFWSAYSEDEGRSWRTIHPSDINASSAPGQLHRMASGRMALVWNRQFPEGKTEFPMSGGDNEWSEIPTSNHREELSIAFSEDEGQTWSAPVVFARQKGKWLSYPYVFERAPGELWITTMQGNVRIKLNEADFIQ
ncbi:MAG: exo-alpha-sialidase [bacterium]|nr:exo-alpha-sialidase [bacterium]